MGSRRQNQIYRTRLAERARVRKCAGCTGRGRNLRRLPNPFTQELDDYHLSCHKRTMALFAEIQAKKPTAAASLAV